MTKEEFKKAANIEEITEAEYKIVEYVYTWSPLISETEGKQQVALLYNTFGIAIFKDMTERAEKAEKIENEMRKARMEYERLRNEYEELRR